MFNKYVYSKPHTVSLFYNYMPFLRRRLLLDSVKHIDAGATEATVNCTIKAWLNNKVPRTKGKSDAL